MFPYHYEDGELFCDGVRVKDLAEKYGTPLYVYSRRCIEDRIARLREAFAWRKPLVCFSVKALSNIHILKVVSEAGCGFDIVSGGELYRVMEAVGDARQVVFAGVGKTGPEIRAALKNGILLFNVESEAELDEIERIARSEGAKALAALRLNPDVDPHTHAYTTTGRKENKFGLSADRIRRIADAAKDLGAVTLSAVHVHIGSQITEPAPYAEAAGRAVDLYIELEERGLDMQYVNLGGGFGVDYSRFGDTPPISDFAEVIRPEIERTGAKLILEPGRFIAANSSILLTRLVYVKPGSGKRFYIVDAGMNDLIRPSLYEARQEIWPVEAETLPPLLGGGEPDTEETEVVGPICETGDFLGKERHLPDLEAGALLAVFGSGAYGFTMASNYNSRPRPAEVLVEGDTHRLIRRRESSEDLIAPEKDL